MVTGIFFHPSPVRTDILGTALVELLRLEVLRTRTH